MYTDKHYIRYMASFNGYNIKRITKQAIARVNELLAQDKEYIEALEADRGDISINCECEAIEFVFNCKPNEVEAGF